MMKYSYGIRLCLGHPTLSADAISAGLECEPTLAWTRGVPRAGITRVPTTTAWQRIHAVSGQRSFFQTVVRLYEWLEIEQRKTFVSNFIADGGRISIYFHLDGASNIGDELSPQSLARLAKLGVFLEIEVFPFIDFDSADFSKPPWG